MNRLTALCAVALLLSAPAAFACEGAVRTLSHCSMAEVESEGCGPTARPICPPGDQMTLDCCDVRSAPVPVPTSFSEIAKKLTSLELLELQTAVPVALPAPRRHTPPAEAFRLHELGRYTLFSSLLL